MDSLNKDEIELIAMELDDLSLLNFCIATKAAKRFCSNDMFWFRRTIKKYGKVQKRENESWKNYYMRKTFREGQGLNQTLYDAARAGDREEIVRLVEMGADPEYGVDGALFVQNQDLADFIRKL